VASTSAVGGAPASAPLLGDRELALFQRLMFSEAGVTLASSKKALVTGRLAKRLRERGCSSFADYHRLLESDDNERQIAVDLLTTNETYFFREPKHFAFLRELILQQGERSSPYRVWSAACSSGEEVYSLAMVLADLIGDDGWSVTGSDINTQVLEKARKGHYGMARTEGIPRQHLERYCLKGKGSQAGTFLIGKELRKNVSFAQVNLSKGLTGLEPFDIIFLRNVMIYFSPETKRQVVQRIVNLLKPGGHLFVGHSESLNGVCDRLQVVKPSVYRRSD
jgi:chemotaxis protein methyltransferase CheR